MPNLPTITVNNTTVYNRLVAAFNSDPAAYKEWLRRALTAEVYRRERQALQDQSDQQQAAKEAELTTVLETEWPTPTP